MLYLEVKCELPPGQVGMSDQPPVTQLGAGRGQGQRGGAALSSRSPIYPEKPCSSFPFLSNAAPRRRPFPLPQAQGSGGTCLGSRIHWCIHRGGNLEGTGPVWGWLQLCSLRRRAGWAGPRLCLLQTVEKGRWAPEFDSCSATELCKKPRPLTSVSLVS